ncbi:MAG: fumarylacetoacetate hydrolase family protein [Spirochaetales bacterium]|uniref:Fumarylacetoacetate hydrolase family protein n=1 Tax=Candidatus Thalassospirochaeta sargassi TaxID=3119039 RepID=A0AAJ1MJT3_9SPIO|nr:fumarylacetoacetate hydrolase family protein [Spirochaetales bacterium]
MIELPILNSEEKYKLKPGKIVALGLNYSEHVKESVSILAGGYKPETPTEPVIFPKASSSLIGPEENIIIPAFIDNYDFEEPRTDYEAELAFIISKDCRNVQEEDAIDYIYGFTCLNDVSQRNLQTGDKAGWFRGKSLDTYCPVGPVIVRTEDIGNPDNLDIVCRLNGQTVQSGNTNQMIFGIKQIVSILSSWFTLEAGDLISTGTPKGVGLIKEGDLVEVEIENIGVLRNPVVRA